MSPFGKSDPQLGLLLGPSTGGQIGVNKGEYQTPSSRSLGGGDSHPPPGGDLPLSHPFLADSARKGSGGAVSAMPKPASD